MLIPFQDKLRSLEESKNIGSKLAKVFRENDVIVLDGDLGTGKTTLIKYICSFYNISEVSSPSFSIVNEYSGNVKVYHFDFYRIKKVEELYDIGFEEYLNDEEAIVFIEWGNLIPEILPNQYYEISLQYTSDNERQIKIVKKN